MTIFTGRNLDRNLRGLKKEEFEGLKLFEGLIVYVVHVVYVVKEGSHELQKWDRRLPLHRTGINKVIR